MTAYLDIRSLFFRELDPAATFSVSNLCEISFDKHLEKFKNISSSLLIYSFPSPKEGEGEKKKGKQP